MDEDAESPEDRFLFECFDDFDVVSDKFRTCLDDRESLGLGVSI